MGSSPTINAPTGCAIEGRGPNSAGSLSAVVGDRAVVEEDAASEPSTAVVGAAPSGRRGHGDAPPVVVEFAVDLVPATTRRRPAPRLPPAVRLLVLAHQIEQVVAEGRARDYAEVARQVGVSRPRIAQIRSLLRLAPALQEFLLLAPPERIDGVKEALLRRMIAAADEAGQWTLLRTTVGEAAPIHVEPSSA